MLFVGMHLSRMEFVKALHSVSSVCGGVMFRSLCRPIRAISLLKSPHSMWVWFGCVVICCVISCFIMGMYLVSLVCVGIYMCINNHGDSGWFFITIICKYGDISAGVGIFVTLPGYGYSLLMSVSSPPLVGVYCHLCCIHLVSACVLLNINL